MTNRVLFLLVAALATTNSTTPALASRVDRFEPNNAATEATPLTPAADVSAVVSPGGDQDWYAFSAQLPVWMIKYGPAVDGIDVAVRSTTRSCSAPSTATIYGPGLPISGTLVSADSALPSVPEGADRHYVIKVEANGSEPCDGPQSYRLSLRWNGIVNAGATADENIKRSTCDYYAGQIRHWRTLARSGTRTQRVAASKRVAAEVRASQRYGCP